MAFLAFLKSVFSESDGTGSFARILSAVLAVGSIIWITHIVLHTHVIPPLSDITLFIGAPYATNKIATKMSGHDE